MMVQKIDLIYQIPILVGRLCELLIQMMQSMLTLVRGCQVVLMRLKGLGAFVIG